MRGASTLGARSLGPPTAADEFFPSWLVCPVDMILGPIAPAAASSSASATRSRHSSTASRTQARSTTPTSSSKRRRRAVLPLIERRLDGVSITGDRALLDHLIDTVPQPVVA